MKMAGSCPPLRGAKESKHPDGVSGPLKTRLSNPKRICARPNTTEVNIDPQTDNVILQLCRTGRAQDLIARLREYADIVRSFLAASRQVQNQVLNGSRNLQWCLTCLGWVLPTSY